MSIQAVRARRLDLLPLMDCVFLVLAVFFYLILFMVEHHGIDLELPAGETTRQNFQPFITVSVDAAGALFVEGEAVSLDGLAAAVKQHRADPEAQIYVSADEKSTYADVARVLDTLRSGGVEHASLELAPAGG